MRRLKLLLPSISSSSSSFSSASSSSSSLSLAGILKNSCAPSFAAVAPTTTTTPSSTSSSPSQRQTLPQSKLKSSSSSSSSNTTLPPLTNENAAEVLSTRAYYALKNHKVSQAVSYLDECGRRYLHQNENGEASKSKKSKISSASTSTSSIHKDQKHKWESVVALWLAMMHLSALRDHEKGISFRQVAASFRAQQAMEEQRIEQKSNNMQNKSSTTTTILNSFSSTSSDTSNNQHQESSNSAFSSSTTFVMATSGVIQFKVSLCADAVLRGLLRKLQKSANLTYGHNHGLWHAFRNVPFLSGYDGGGFRGEAPNGTTSEDDKNFESEFEKMMMFSSSSSYSNNTSSNNKSSSSFDTSPLYLQALRVRLLYRALVDAGIAIAPDLVHHVSSFLPPLLSEVSTSKSTHPKYNKLENSETETNTTDVDVDNTFPEEFSSNRPRSSSRRHKHSSFYDIQRKRRIFERNNKNKESTSHNHNHHHQQKTLQEAALLSAEEHQEQLERQRAEKIQQKKEELEALRLFEEELEFERAGCDAFFHNRSSSSSSDGRELLFSQVTSNNAVDTVFENCKIDEVEKSFGASSSSSSSASSLSLATSQFVERPAWWKVLKQRSERILSESLLLVVGNSKNNRASSADGNGDEDDNSSDSSSIELHFLNRDQEKQQSITDALRNIPVQELQTFARAASHLSSSNNEACFDWKQLVLIFGLSFDKNSSSTIVQKILLLNHIFSAFSHKNEFIKINRQKKLLKILLESNQNNQVDTSSSSSFSDSFAIDSLLRLLSGDRDFITKDQNVISFVQSKTKRTTVHNLLLLCVFKIPQLLKMMLATPKNTNTEDNHHQIDERRLVQVQKNLCEVVDLLFQIVSSETSSQTKNNEKEKQKSADSGFNFKIESEADSLNASRRVFEKILMTNLAVIVARRTIINSCDQLLSSALSGKQHNSQLLLVLDKIVSYYQSRVSEASFIADSSKHFLIDSMKREFLEKRVISQLLAAFVQNSNTTNGMLMSLGTLSSSTSVRIIILSQLASRIISLTKTNQTENSETTRMKTFKLVDQFFEVLMPFLQEQEQQDAQQERGDEEHVSLMRKFVRLVLCKTSSSSVSERIFLFTLLKHCSKRKCQLLFATDDNNKLFSMPEAIKMIPERFKIILKTKAAEKRLVELYGEFTVTKLKEFGLVRDISVVNTGNKVLNESNNLTGSHTQQQIDEHTTAHRLSPHINLRFDHQNSNKKYHHQSTTTKLSWVASLRALSSALTASSSSSLPSQNNTSSSDRVNKALNIAIDACYSANRFEEAVKILDIISNIHSQKQNNKAIKVDCLILLQLLEKNKKYNVIYEFVKKNFLLVNTEEMEKEIQKHSYQPLFTDLPLLRIFLESLVLTKRMNEVEHLLTEFSEFLAARCSSSDDSSHLPSFRTLNSKRVSLEGLMSSSSSSESESSSSSAIGKHKEILEQFPHSVTYETKFKKCITNAILTLGMSTIAQNNSNSSSSSSATSLLPLYQACVHVDVPFYKELTEVLSSSGTLSDQQQKEQEQQQKIKFAMMVKKNVQQPLHRMFISSNDIIRVTSSLGSHILIQEAKKEKAFIGEEETENSRQQQQNQQQQQQQASEIKQTSSASSDRSNVSLWQLPLELYKKLLRRQKEFGVSTSSAIEPRTVVNLMQVLNLSKRFDESISVLEESEQLWYNDNNDDDIANTRRDGQRKLSAQQKLRQDDIDMILHRGALALIAAITSSPSSSKQISISSMRNKVMDMMKKREMDHWPSYSKLKMSDKDKK